MFYVDVEPEVDVERSAFFNVVEDYQSFGSTWTSPPFKYSKPGGTSTEDYQEEHQRTLPERAVSVQPPELPVCRDDIQRDEALRGGLQTQAEESKATGSDAVLYQRNRNQSGDQSGRTKVAGNRVQFREWKASVVFPRLSNPQVWVFWTLFSKIQK